VGYYKASLLVSNQYGRSVTAENIFYISPDENVYNFQTFARIYFILFKQMSIIKIKIL
jgi:hypothetical protein